MTELPPILLCLEGSAGSGILAAWRDPQGTLRASRATPPVIPESALLLTWPRGPLSPAAFDFARRVGEAGGAVRPLTTVLSRLGVRPSRGWSGLIDALLPHRADPEDLEHCAQELLDAVEERLAAFARTPPETKPTQTPPPQLADALATLPDLPGVYTFLARDRTPLYVGKAKSLRARVPQHLGEQADAERRRVLTTQADHVEWEVCGSELEALVREHLRLAEGLPPLNTQHQVAPRGRGALRTACWLLALPSSQPQRVEVCLVDGRGAFHWESVPQASRVPQRLWRHLIAFLDRSFTGWAPGEPEEELSAQRAQECCELALTWLARHQDSVSRIDLAGELAGRALQRRLRGLLGESPQVRVEIR